MTQAEFKQYNGYKKKKPTEKDKDQPCPPAQLDLSQPLPDTVDYRQANPAVLSPVKDQGACGSCWAFATAETVEAAVALATKQAPPVLSPQEVVSCTDNPDKCGGAGGCQGATAELGFQGVKENGLCSNQAWPYTASDGKCNNPCKAIVNITGCARLKTNNETELMYAVATVGPIAISVDASTWNTYRSGIFTSCLNEKYYDIDHAVQLVGYGEEKGNKYWIVRNSWGKTWGEGGYIRVARLAADDPKACKKDVKPGDGVACAGETDPITVCGECGLWYDSCYPVGAYYLDSYVKQPEKHEWTRREVSCAITTLVVMEPAVES
eukprot:g1405.t1